MTGGQRRILAFRCLVVFIAATFTVLSAGYIQAQPPAPQSESPVTRSGVSTYRWWREQVLGVAGDTTDVLYTETVNWRYRTEHVRRHGTTMVLVLQERFKTRWVENMDPLGSEITVSAWPADAPTDASPIWTIQDRGYGTDIVEHLYRIKGGGCCDDVKPDAYYNLLTGKRILESSVPLITIRVAHANKGETRHVGFVGHCSSDSVLTGRNRNPCLGEIEYLRGEDAVARLLIAGAPRGVVSPVVTYRLQDLRVSSHGKPVGPDWIAEGYSDFSIVADFSSIVTRGYETRGGSPLRIEVPIKDDVFDKDHATLGAGIIIESLGD